MARLPAVAMPGRTSIGWPGMEACQKTKVNLKELIDFAKCFEAITYAAQLMKTSRSNHQSITQVKSKLGGNRTTPCHWYAGSHHKLAKNTPCIPIRQEMQQMWN